MELNSLSPFARNSITKDANDTAIITSESITSSETGSEEYIPNSRKRARRPDIAHIDLCNITNVCNIYKDLSIANGQLSSSLEKHIKLNNIVNEQQKTIEEYKEMVSSLEHDNKTANKVNILIMIMIVLAFCVSHYIENTIGNMYIKDRMSVTMCNTTLNTWTGFNKQ